MLNRRRIAAFLLALPIMFGVFTNITGCAYRERDVYYDDHHDHPDDHHDDHFDHDDHP
jgi:hypothetical protein